MYFVKFTVKYTTMLKLQFYTNSLNLVTNRLRTGGRIAEYQTFVT